MGEMGVEELPDETGGEQRGGLGEEGLVRDANVHESSDAAFESPDADSESPPCPATGAAMIVDPPPTEEQLDSSSVKIEIVAEGEPNAPTQSPPTVVKINVGGRAFATSHSNASQHDWIVSRILKEGLEWTLDEQGALFFDRDPRVFESYIMPMVRSPARALQLPAVDTEEFQQLQDEADAFEFAAMRQLLTQAQVDAAERETADKAERLQDKRARIERELQAAIAQAKGAAKHSSAARRCEELQIQLQSLDFAKDRTLILGRRKRSSLMHRHEPPSDISFNLLIVGVTGTGKSSSINTLLDNKVCAVSGAQAQGTRGMMLGDGVIPSAVLADKSAKGAPATCLGPSAKPEAPSGGAGDQIVSFLDTQGLGADTSITDQELLEKIMLATESILKLGVINHVLISFDLEARATPTMTANQLTLTELFGELKRSCFVCFTKWNTNAVCGAWNTPLRTWVRRWRRAVSVEEIAEDPPSYEDLYKAYTAYLMQGLQNDEDGGAFTKMGYFLAFFEARVLWMFNLDPVEQEELEEGTLAPHIEFMYRYYRTQALRTLAEGSTRVVASELPALRRDRESLRDKARELVLARDRKISGLELAGRDPERRVRLFKVFDGVSRRVRENIAHREMRDKLDYVEQVATVAEVVKDVAKVGCIIS